MANRVSTSLLQQSELEAVVCRALECSPSSLQRLECDSEKTGSEAGGFMSKCGSLSVSAAVDGRPHKLHLFVKHVDAEDVAVGLGCFAQESRYYQRLWPVLSKAWRCNPNLDIDPTDLGPMAYLGTDKLMVMEDMTHRGYRALRQDWLWSGLSYDEVHQTLRALARLHAASLVAERCLGVRLADVDPELLKEKFFTRRPGAMGRRLFDTAGETTSEYLLPHLISSLDVPQTATELRRLQDLGRDAYHHLDTDWVRRTTKSLLVMGHGDAWPNNVLVKHDKEGRIEHAVLVDYQMVRLCPPSFDVMMFLHVAARRDFRRKHQDSLLKGYYDDLVGFCQQRGLDITEELSFAAFMSSVEHVSPLCRAIGVAYVPILGGNAADMVSLFADGEARCKLLSDSGTRGPLVQRWLQTAGARYQDIILEYLEDLFEIPPRQPA